MDRAPTDAEIRWAINIAYPATSSVSKDLYLNVPFEELDFLVRENITQAIRARRDTEDRIARWLDERARIEIGAGLSLMDSSLGELRFDDTAHKVLVAAAQCIRSGEIE